MVGPVAMAYELVSQAKDNPENLDLSLILSAATKGLQLLGNANNHLAKKCRIQVLSKIGQSYTSLSNEKRENNEKELFGQQCEQRLKQCSQRNGQSNFLWDFTPKSKQFFLQRGTPSARPGIRRVVTNCKLQTTGAHSLYVNPTDHQGLSWGGAEQHQPSPSQCLSSSELFAKSIFRMFEIVLNLF